MLHRIGPGKLKHSLLPDLARLAPTFVVPGIVTLVSAPILFGVLGAKGYGVFAIAVAIANGVPQLTASWVESTTLRFGHLGPPTRSSQFWSILASGLAGTLVAAVVLPGESPLLWVEIGALTAAVGAYVLRAAQLQSRMRFGSVSGLAGYRAIVGSALAIVLGGTTESAGGAIVGLTVGFVVVTALTGRTPTRQSDATSPVTAPEALKPNRFGLASAGVALGLYALGAGDRFVLNAFQPLEVVGVYAISYTLTEMVMRLIPSVVLVVVRPRVFRLWDLEEPQIARGMIADAIAVLLWAMAVSQIVWLVLAGSIVSVVDPHVAGPVSVGIASLSVAFAISLLHTADLNQSRIAGNTIVCAALAITADILVTPSLGAVGAALVTAAAYSGLMVLHWIGSGLRFDGRNAVIATVAFLSITANGLLTLADVSAISVVPSVICLVLLAPLAFRSLGSLVLDSVARERS